MNDVEKIIEVLSIVAIILVIAICGLVAIYLLFQYKKNKKKNNNENEIIEEKEQTNNTSYNIKSIFNFMEFEKIEDNMIIQKRGKYLMAIECQGVNYDLMSEMERTSVEQGFIQFLNTLRTEIQIYVQTRTVNLEESILTYKSKFNDIEEKYRQLEERYREIKKSDEYSEREKQHAYMELIRQKDKDEYTKDIITNTERNSLNSSVLHKKYYIIRTKL